jgi:hypothetical protein
LFPVCRPHSGTAPREVGLLIPSLPPPPRHDRRRSQGDSILRFAAKAKDRRDHDPEYRAHYTSGEESLQNTLECSSQEWVPGTTPRRYS